MSLLEYSEVIERKFILLDGEPYEVLSSHVFRMQQRKPQNATKLKNLISGKVKEYTFHQSDRVEEAEINKREIKYLYNNRGEWWFCEPNNPAKRFKIEPGVVGAGGQFMKPNIIVEMLTFGEEEDTRIIGLKMPIKVELKVVEAPPAVKGDTAKGGTKQVKLETGATINAPLFIAEGDVIRINTDTGEYVERA
jgi:elongation factor P